MSGSFVYAWTHSNVYNGMHEKDANPPGKYKIFSMQLWSKSDIALKRIV
jgi:hypothetical protein